MSELTMGQSGEIHLPETVRERYGLKPETPIRMIETKSGIFLIPMTDEPMSEELRLELEEWQSLSLETWGLFPFEDS